MCESVALIAAWLNFQFDTGSHMQRIYSRVLDMSKFGITQSCAIYLYLYHYMRLYIILDFKYPYIIIWH